MIGCVNFVPELHARSADVRRRSQNFADVRRTEKVAKKRQKLAERQGFEPSIGDKPILP